jgi:hypothetical protein
MVRDFRVLRQKLSSASIHATGAQADCQSPVPFHDFAARSRRLESPQAILLAPPAQAVGEEWSQSEASRPFRCHTTNENKTRKANHLQETQGSARDPDWCQNDGTVRTRFLRHSGVSVDCRSLISLRLGPAPRPRLVQAGDKSGTTLLPNQSSKNRAYETEYKKRRLPHSRTALSYVIKIKGGTRAACLAVLKKRR